MNILTLELVRNELLQTKMLAEANIEFILMDQNLSPEDKKNKIIEQLKSLKNSSLMLNFWDEFITNKVIIPNEEDNNQ